MKGWRTAPQTGTCGSCQWQIDVSSGLAAKRTSPGVPQAQLHQQGKGKALHSEILHQKGDWALEQAPQGIGHARVPEVFGQVHTLRFMM